MGSTHLGSTHAQAEEAASILRTTVAIRERAKQLLSRARHGESPWFIVDEGFMETAANEVVAATRKRQVGGDTADQYFARTECVAGVQDMRFQELMPDVLHWLGIKKIHRLVSMSNMKYDAITGSGIEIGERVNIPDELIPADARVEMDAKVAAGYFTPGTVPDAEELKKTKGRGL